MHHATRFIRAHAKDYQIDPERIGICGGSAGGHLSLMQGIAGTSGDPKAKDPVERVSSRVQCDACYFPPTDFLNWRREGDALDYHTVRNPFKPALAVKEIDPHTRIATIVIHPKKISEAMRQTSPVREGTLASARGVRHRRPADDQQWPSGASHPSARHWPHELPSRRRRLGPEVDCGITEYLRLHHAARRSSVTFPQARHE
jgi:hypothetical protein